MAAGGVAGAAPGLPGEACGAHATVASQRARQRFQLRSATCWASPRDGLVGAEAQQQRQRKRREAEEHGRPHCRTARQEPAGRAWFGLGLARRGRAQRTQHGGPARQRPRRHGRCHAQARAAHLGALPTTCTPAAAPSHASTAAPHLVCCATSQAAGLTSATFHKDKQRWPPGTLAGWAARRKAGAQERVGRQRGQRGPAQAQRPASAGPRLPPGHLPRARRLLIAAPANQQPRQLAATTPGNLPARCRPQCGCGTALGSGASTASRCGVPPTN